MNVKDKEILLLSFLFSFGWNFGAGTDLAMAKRLEGANNPELLPKEYTTVIDVAGFLSQGQENRIKEAVARLEADTGFKLRVLAQNYPITPGTCTIFMAICRGCSAGVLACG